MNSMNADRLRVLVVDDCAATRRMISHILSRAPGIESVATAVDGREATAMIAADCPDIVVTDWEMPDMGGIAICQWIRQASLPHYVYVLLLTAKSHAEEMVEGLAAGADDFVSKPTNRAVLQARIQAGARIIAMERNLRELFESDPLTSVLNRRAFRDKVSVEWERMTRHQKPLSCVMVDLDFFKKVNDTHGHTAGDLVIVNVARTLRDRRRASDLVCRYGGEEFCVLLPETNEQGAAIWAERCRAEIAELAIVAGKETLRISASFGVAERQEDGATPESLIDVADQALAVAKASGRNRVVCFSTLNDPIMDITSLQGFKGPLIEATAKDAMTTALFCPRQDDTVQWVTDLFLQLRLSSAPVVDDNGQLVGIVSETDMMGATSTGDGWQKPVRDIMRPQVVSFDEDAPLKRIFQFFLRASVRRVVIVAEGHPTGVISRANLLRWFRNWSTVHSMDDCEGNMGSSPENHKRHLMNIVTLLETAEERTATVRRYLGGAPLDPIPRVVREATRLQEIADDLLGHCRSVAADVCCVHRKARRNTYNEHVSLFD